MSKKDENLEQELELTYKVKICTYGKPVKHVDDIGQALADSLGLQFTNVEVGRGKKTYRRRVNTPWEPLAKDDSGLVDSPTDTRVV